MDSSIFNKMSMTTPEMGNYQRFAPNPLLKITLLDSNELRTILLHDTGAYKIVLIWSCWSKSVISQMLTHKDLFTSPDYSLYLVSADLNNNEQRDTINRFLTSLAVSDRAYQINSKIDITDLQNSKATTSFINYMTGHARDMLQLNVCMSFPYALIYDRTGNIVETMSGHFELSALRKYKRAK